MELKKIKDQKNQKQKELENQIIKKWEDKFDQDLKLKEEEETLKFEQINKKRQEESRLKEEERTSKFEELKSNKLVPYKSHIKGHASYEDR